MLRKDLKTKFLDQLTAKKLINNKQREVLEDVDSFISLEHKLKSTGWIEVETLAKEKASFFKLPYADLVGEQVSSTVLKLIPRELAENYLAVAFRKNNDELSVGLVEPANLKTREALEFLARERQLKIKFHAISQASYSAILKRYSALKTEVAEALGVAQKKMAEEVPVEKLEEIVTSAPISKMVAVILRHAVEERASDIHIEPVMNQTRVRYRVDGVLKTSLLLPKYVHTAIVSRIKVMANLKIDETRLPQDGRIRIKIGAQEIDFRISTLPLYRNEKVVMRILDTSEGVSTLEKLGFADKNLEVMQENIKKPHGMFLVTGPTGSGKSTTLYAVLNIINKEEINIITLEDPVEYYLKGINQSQVNADVGLTFASGLRSILRQDPDVVMVGEIRDQETAGLAVHAALTGHIVLSTLHTNDAFGAVPRLLDMQVEDFLVSSTLNVVIAQRLVRKLCKDCKTEIKASASLQRDIAEELKKINPEAMPEDIKIQESYQIWQAKGCSRCGDTGYRGRVAISEVLPVTEKIQATIENKEEWSKKDELFYELGMINVKQDGIYKVLRGQTSIEEVVRATKE